MRLIDADTLKEEWTIASPEPYNTDASEVLDSIETTPTIDAVPVVRCKDCIYYEKGIDYPPYCNCPSGGISDYPQEDDFCSYGKRREEK